MGWSGATVLLERRAGCGLAASTTTKNIRKDARSGAEFLKVKTVLRFCRSGRSAGKVTGHVSEQMLMGRRAPRESGQAQKVAGGRRPAVGGQSAREEETQKDQKAKARAR